MTEDINTTSAPLRKERATEFQKLLELAEQLDSQMVRLEVTVAALKQSNRTKSPERMRFWDFLSGYCITCLNKSIKFTKLNSHKSDGSSGVCRKDFFPAACHSCEGRNPGKR